MGYRVNALYSFPILFGLSLVGCLAETFPVEAIRRRADEIAAFLSDESAVGGVGAGYAREGDGRGSGVWAE